MKTDTLTYVSTEDWFDDGRLCRERVRSSRYLNQYAPLAGEYAIKLFLPPEPQGDTAMQVARPRDSKYADWIRGWDSYEM